jgi:small-conductance mechanosensitive channel
MIQDTFHWLSQQSFLSISLARWLSAALITVIGFAAVMLTSRIVAGHLRKHPGASPGPLRAMTVAALEHTKIWLMLLLFAAIGAQVLGLHDGQPHWLGNLGAVVAALQLSLWLGSAISAWTRSRLSADTGQPQNPVVMGMLSWILRITVWATLLMAALSFMGVNITAFVASLGVGGVAVALALQSVLGDLFASMSIGLDKPFEIGQFITFGDIAGTIEHVGVKTTRIRSISGEQIIVSNAELLKNSLHNYGRMSQRRIVFAFGVTYNTDRGVLRQLPGMVREIIEGLDNTRFDRAHFKSFGASSLDYEVVYFVTGPEYGMYMDVQQAINLNLMDRFAEAGVEFAFPTRTLYVAGAVNARLENPRARGADEPPESSPGHPAADSSS